MFSLNVNDRIYNLRDGLLFLQISLILLCFDDVSLHVCIGGFTVKLFELWGDIFRSDEFGFDYNNGECPFASVLQFLIVITIKVR